MFILLPQNVRLYNSVDFWTPLEIPAVVFDVFFSETIFFSFEHIKKSIKSSFFYFPIFFAL